MKALNKKAVVAMMLMCSMMSASTMTPVGAANYTTPTIVIDSRTIDSDTAPFIVDGTTLVPLRVISENMGASVDWNGETRQVTVTKGNTNIKLTIDEYLAYVNGEATTISLSPRIENSRTMVPLRFIGETLDCEVGWDAETKTVYITTNDEETPVPIEIEGSVDSHGRTIRKTNLPKNASMFPYIAEEIPNWAYETQSNTLKNNIWGPAKYTDTGLKGDTPKDVANSDSSVFPIGLNGGVYETVQKFADLQLNIDYNTIGDSWVNDMLSCFSDTQLNALAAAWKNDPIKTVKEDLQDYVSNNYKKNHLVTTGEVKVMPEGMWVDVYGYVHVPVYTKLTINNNDTKTGLVNVTFGGSSVGYNSPEGYKGGQTYEAVVTYTLTKDSKGTWKIAYSSCDVDQQINPSVDSTDGVKDKASNRLSKFKYWYSAGSELDRYADVDYTQISNPYPDNPIAAQGTYGK